MKRGLKVWFFLIVVLISLWCVASVSATDYYVNASKACTGDGTSEANAWCSIANVSGASFNPGDNIYFARGETWSEILTIPSNGTSGNHIIIDAYGTGSPPIIDGGNVRAFNVQGINKHYITVRNLNVTGWINTGISDSQGKSWLIENNTIANGGNDAAPDHGIRVYTSNGGALLTGIIIRNNTIGTVNSAENDAVGNNGILVQGVDGAIISGNNISTTNTVGIRFVLNTGSSDNVNITVEKNNIYNSYGGIINSNSDNSTIQYNKIHDGKGFGIGNSYSSDNTFIAYNIIYNLSNSTNLWNGIDVNHDSQNGTIYNNIIYKVYRHSLVIANGTAACNGWVIKNNIFDASENDAGNIGGSTPRAIAIGIRGDNTYTSDNNLLRPGGAGYVASYGTDDGTLYNLADYQTASSQDANSIDSDPLFTNPSNNIFTLQASSPAIDAGVDLGASYDDGLDSDSVWPNSVLTLDQDDYGAGWEIGAYVYEDTVVPTISFSCSPTLVITGETITCSCSATDDIDSSPTVSYTANPSTSNTGTFTTTCTVTDSSGNSVSSTATYTVEQTSDSGTPTTTWTTHTITENLFEQGYTRELGVRNRIKVQIEDEDHFIGVVSISESQATIEISSDPVQVILAAGEDAKVDVTDDDFYDIYVLLNGITNNKANVTIQKIHEEIPEGGTGVETTGEQLLEEEKSLIWLWLVLGLVVVIVIILTIYFMKRQRKMKEISSSEVYNA